MVFTQYLLSIYLVKNLRGIYIGVFAFSEVKQCTVIDVNGKE